MAIFKSFLLGSVRNSVANLVMFSSRGMGIVRGKPLTVRNPNTPAQRTQRAKMKELFDLSRRFGPVLTVGFPSRPQNQTRYNAFVAANTESVSVDEAFIATVDYTAINCSAGGLDIPDVIATVDTTERKLMVTQTAQEWSGAAADTDVVYVVLYETVKKMVRVVKLSTRNTTSTQELSTPRGWDIANIHIYAFAASENGQRTSGTLYVSRS